MAITLPGFTNSSLSKSSWGDWGGLSNWFKNYNKGTGVDWFGQFGVLPTIGLGLQGLAGLGDFWMGLNNYNLAKDAYNFQKALANRNLQNQGKLINNTYDTAANTGAGLIGGVDAYGNYGSINNDILTAQNEQAKKQYVDTSYIG